MHFLKLYFVALGIYLVIDFLWIGVIAQPMYQKEVGSLMKDPVSWLPALLVYLIVPLGLVVFAIYPAKDVTHALLLGALLGFVVNGTYDLTNLATLKQWSLKLSLIDMFWGAFVLGLTSALTTLLLGFPKA